MAGREAPARAHLPKQSVGEHAARSPPAQAQSGRCLGATAQLAALHRTLTGGFVAQLRVNGAAQPSREAKIIGQPSTPARAATRVGLLTLPRPSAVVQRVPDLETETRVRVKDKGRGTVRYIYQDGGYLVKPTRPGDDVILGKYPEALVEPLTPIDQELLYERDRPLWTPHLAGPAGPSAGSGPTAPAPVDQELVDEHGKPLFAKDFEQVQILAEAIMAQYPPDEYHYLGLGKSPTPLMAFLEAYGENVDVGITASNMPLSKFSHKIGRMSAVEKAEAGDELTGDQHRRLQDHFDRFVPTVAALDGKKLLLIDFVQSGRSLVATQRHLEAYLQTKYGRSFWEILRGESAQHVPQVAALPLAVEEQQVEGGGMKATMDKLGLTPKAMMIPGTLDDKDSLAARMAGEKYKPLAEFPGDFKISAASRPTTGQIARDPREYGKLKDDFARFLAEDAPFVGLMIGEAAVDEVEEASLLPHQ